MEHNLKFKPKGRKKKEGNQGENFVIVQSKKCLNKKIKPFGSTIVQRGGVGRTNNQYDSPDM